MEITIVTPTARTARAGNRTTAARWARLLTELGHRVETVPVDEASVRDLSPELMIALHAWRSAGAIARFRARHPERPLVVALTGTDLYHFLEAEPEPTLRSLDLADRLIGLHDLVHLALPERHRGKLRVVLQSAQGHARPMPPREDCFEVLVVGHLRNVKDPFRAALAARRLPAASRIRVTHLGAAHDAAWAAAARAEMADNPRYDWLGDVPGTMVRRLLTRARLMVLSSRSEGGANVISEAIVAGTPVIASDIPGSRGLIGADYPGCYPFGDEAALADLLLRAEQEPAFLHGLSAQCAARASLFRPAREREALRRLVEEVAPQTRV